ncbi:MAG: DUF6502 family protein [Halieaceae bacterium]|jgi:hypothetical protein|nr:DUF6502 family protein [Halieaceae bacterium]
MTESIEKVLRSAVYRLLRPLVRVMLRHGMAYGSFAEMARKAYVEEGLAQLRHEGRRATISAVASMSGLTRKEASRLAAIDIIDGGADTDQRYNRAVRVITAWAVDPRFAAADGSPRVLPLEGEDSFAALVKDYSGDVTTAAMLTTLEASGTLCREEDGVRLLNRAYLPTKTPVASLNILGKDVGELLTTIDHNLDAAPEDRVFQRKVSNYKLEASAVVAFRELSNQKSQELLEEYDAWLSKHEVSDGDAPAEALGCYVAVGIYYFDQTLDKEDSNETDL